MQRSGMVLVACAWVALMAARADAAPVREFMPPKQPTRIELNPCRDRVPHVPRADVEYQPGVNATGKRVVPADLGYPPTAKPMLEQPLVVLRAPLSPYVRGERNKQALGDSFIHFGTVDTLTGNARLNGAPLTPPDACPEK